MKFVRWLGAFGSGSSLSEAAGWELSQTDRQVAVEPLHRGRSLIGHAKIGLVIDHDASRFHAGWLFDAWTDWSYCQTSFTFKSYDDARRFVDASQARK